MSAKTLHPPMVVVSIIALVGVGFLIGHETSSTPVTYVSTAAATQIKFITPWTQRGPLSTRLTVKKHEDGSCWTGSIAVNDSDARRCTSGDAIFDPCFVPVYSFRPTEVACMSSPWSDVVLLHLTKRLPTSQSDHFPGENGPKPQWALRLSNGDRCVIGTGANGALGGVDLNYYCASGASAGALNTRTEPWTVEYYRPGSDVLYGVDVTVAWGG